MVIDSNLLNGYQSIAQGLCEPNFADYYRLTGLTREDWLDTGRSLRFLEKYSFIDKPLPPEWILSKERVYNLPFKKEDFLYPTHVFKDGFVSSCKQSGALFDKTGYEALQSSLINMGEKQLFIEKVQECYDPRPLSLSLPVRLSWEELLSGGFIVSFLIDFPHGFFFLFSPSALWGLFIANDALFDVEILGVKIKYQSCFSPYYQYESSFEK
jgi:hypothetical protein